MAACPLSKTKRRILRLFRDDDLTAYSTIVNTPKPRGSLRTPDEERRPEALAAMAWWLGQWELRGT